MFVAPKVAIEPSTSPGTEGKHSGKRKRVHRGTRGKRRKQTTAADCPPSGCVHEAAQPTDLNREFTVEQLRSRESPQRSAFGILAEAFTQYEYDLSTLERWVPRKTSDEKCVSRADSSGWPLDIPNVECIDLEAVGHLAKVSSQELSVVHACEIISSPEAYFSLRLSGGNGPSGDRGKLPKPSFTFAPFRDELLEKRFVRAISRKQIRQFVLGFTVPKPKKRTLRTVLDGRNQNAQQTRPPEVKLATLDDILLAVQDFPLCQELDALGFFHQFELHPEIAADWVLKIGKERFAWTRMPMGWSHAVFVAHTVASLLAEVSVSDVRILVYIDNVYIFGKTKRAIDLATTIFLERCNFVRATFEITTATTSSLTVLGVSCDLLRKQVSVPQSFIQKFATVLDLLPELFIKNDSGDKNPIHFPTTRLLWKVLGSLVWATRVLGIEMCAYGSLLAWISRRSGHITADPTLWEKPCSIWPAAYVDLECLIEKVIRNVPRPLYTLASSLYVHDLFTDASDLGHASVHCGPHLHGPIFKARWSKSMQGRIIAERELFALVQGIKETKQALPHVGLIRAFNDNTNVISWVKRRRGKSTYSNLLLVELFSLLGPTGIEMFYVPSAKNIADGPSRAL